MMADGAAIRGRARAAYERAMVRRGLARLWPLAVLVPVALALHTPATPWRTAMAAMCLGAALLATGWRGGAWARGALWGVLGGVPAFIVPSLVMPAETACASCVHGSATWTTCMAACSVASFASGLALAHLARGDRAPRAFAIAAATCAGLTASLTCSLAGGAGLAGVALGVVVASVPVIVWGPRATT